MRALVLIALAGFLAPSWATNTNTQTSISQISARAVEAKYGRADQMWRDWTIGKSPSISAGTTLGTALAVTRHKGPSPLMGEVIDVDVKRVLPWANITRAVAKSLPLISTALAIKDIADAIRCREGFGGGAECDPGQDETTTTGYTACRDIPGPTPYTCRNGASAIAAAQALVGAYPSSNIEQWRAQDCASGTCDYYKRTKAADATTWGSWNYQDTVGGSPATITQCPEIVVNSVHLVPVVGPDGKCATNVYEPASEDTVQAKGETYGDKSKAPNIVGDLNAAGKPVDHPFPEIDPVPSSVNGPRETTTHPDGSTTIKDTRFDFQPTSNGYGWVPTVITKDYAPGATIPPPGEVSDGTSTTGTAPKDDIITCGLPTTPPCKIDETGTASAPADDSATKVTGLMSGLLLCITTPSSCLPALPDMNWSFSLPTGCAPIPLSGFAKFGVEEFNLCPYQPMVHDLMSMFWAGIGLWSAVGMMFKGSH